MRQMGKSSLYLYRFLLARFSDFSDLTKPKDIDQQTTQYAHRQIMIGVCVVYIRTYVI